MKRSTLGWLAAAVIVVAGGLFAYLFWFAGGSGEPSTELTTPELAATTTTRNAQSSEPGTSEPSGPSESERTFVIDPSRTTARFELDEVLNGNPTHVVGTTDQVAGQVRLDLADLASATFSDVVINARTLTTGSERRDRAIRGPIILDSASDENELILFAVTSIDGLDGDAGIGESFDFTITGDLTIKGNTQPVTFSASVMQTDETTIEGMATAEITRDMFEIGIPNVPSVADVTNEVLIALEFVATAG